jgi:hypothetical protein
MFKLVFWGGKIAASFLYISVIVTGFNNPVIISI